MPGFYLLETVINKSYLPRNISNTELDKSHIVNCITNRVRRLDYNSTIREVRGLAAMIITNRHCLLRIMILIPIYAFSLVASAQPADLMVTEQITKYQQQYTEIEVMYLFWANDDIYVIKH